MSEERRSRVEPHEGRTTIDPRTIHPRLPPAIGERRRGQLRAQAAESRPQRGAPPRAETDLSPCPRSTPARPCRTAGPPARRGVARHTSDKHRSPFSKHFGSAPERASEREGHEAHLDLRQRLERARLLLAQDVADVHGRRGLERTALASLRIPEGSPVSLRSTPTFRRDNWQSGRCPRDVLRPRTFC